MNLAAFIIMATVLIFDDGLVTNMESGEQHIYTTDTDGNLWILDNPDDAYSTDYEEQGDEE